MNMIDYNFIKLALYNRGFKFQVTPRTLMLWYDVAKDYYISVEFRYVSDEIEISGFANRMCAYRRNGKFTEQEVMSYIDECIILLKNMIVRKRITDIDKDFSVND